MPYEKRSGGSARSTEQSPIILPRWSLARLGLLLVAGLSCWALVIWGAVRLWTG